jgi:site-specific DNA recombinase
MGAARRKGKWVGGRPFLGYDIVPGGGALMVNETEASRVREIFKLYLEKQSMQATVENLNDRGWTMKQWITQKGRTFGGGRFTKSSLHHLLTNVAYIGKVNYKGHIADAEFTGIVEPDIFEAVKSCLKENSQCSGARVRNKHHALLGGILRCGHCDSQMIHSYTKRGKGKIYRYYVCNRAAKEGWSKCPSPSLPAAEVEKFVIEEIARIGADKQLCSEIVCEHERNRRQECKEAVATKRKLERQQEALTESLRRVSGKGDATQLADLQRQRMQIESDITKLDSTITALSDKSLTEDELLKAIHSFHPAWESLTLHERIRLLRLLIHQVTYDGENGEIAVTFHPNGIKSIETEEAMV